MKQTLREELARLSNDFLGTAVIGDLNVHSCRWLQHSNGESVEGHALQDVCRNHGLEQKVKAPTRNEYLLDLVLTDVKAVKCTVSKKVADHALVVATFFFQCQKKNK